jgi:hypothetical protein
VETTGSRALSYKSLEQWGHENHPLRPIRAMVGQACRKPSRGLYSKVGWPSIPPEKPAASSAAASHCPGVFGSRTGPGEAAASDFGRAPYGGEGT